MISNRFVSIFLVVFSFVLLVQAQAFALDPIEYEIHTEKRTGKVISIINKAVSREQGRIALQARVAKDQKEVESAALSSLDSFLDSKGTLFGVKKYSEELYPTNVHIDKLGITRVSLQRMYKGIPVRSKEVLGHLNSVNEVIGINGDFGNNITLETTKPKVQEKRAIKIAKLDLEKRNNWKTALRIAKRGANKFCRNKTKSSGNQPKCITKELKRFKKANEASVSKNPKLYILDNNQTPSLIWEMTLSDLSGEMYGEYQIDALSGKILKFDSGERHLRRSVYDCSWPLPGDKCQVNKEQFVPGYGNYTFGRRENDPPTGPNPLGAPYSGSTDVDMAHEHFIPLIHNYYLDKFNREGANARGGTGDGTSFAPYDLTIFVTNGNGSTSGQAYCVNGGYAWANQNSVAFCRGSLSEDTLDLLGHEYTHIVSRNMREVNGSYISLAYSGEAGALNEHFSDVMGEALEFSVHGDNNWKFGGGANVPLFRDLQNPENLIDEHTPVTPYPDKYSSVNFYCGNEDNGGIHHNSTVPSKAAYLASKGGSFNGCEIQGIGLAKVEQIWYHALTTYFTTDTTFNAAFAHFNQACQDFVVRPDALIHLDPGLIITENDCKQVKAALQAVELNQAGACSGIPAETPACALPGPVVGDFNDDKTVDLWDYNVFKKEFFGFSETLNSDANNDGFITEADYAIWLNAYNQPNAPALPTKSGDCNGDNISDGSDFLMWQRMFGKTGPALACDFNADGIIDGIDLNLWKTGFGN